MPQHSHVAPWEDDPHVEPQDHGFDHDSDAAMVAVPVREQTDTSTMLDRLAPTTEVPHVEHLATLDHDGARCGVGDLHHALERLRDAVERELSGDVVPARLADGHGPAEVDHRGGAQGSDHARTSCSADAS